MNISNMMLNLVFLTKSNVFIGAVDKIQVKLLCNCFTFQMYRALCWCLDKEAVCHPVCRPLCLGLGSTKQHISFQLL